MKTITLTLNDAYDVAESLANACLLAQLVCQSNLGFDVEAATAQTEAETAFEVVIIQIASAGGDRPTPAAYPAAAKVFAALVGEDAQ